MQTQTSKKLFYHLLCTCAFIKFFFWNKGWGTKSILFFHLMALELLEGFSHVPPHIHYPQTLSRPRVTSTHCLCEIEDLWLPFTEAYSWLCVTPGNKSETQFFTCLPCMHYYTWQQQHSFCRQLHCCVFLTKIRSTILGLVSSLL